MNSERRKQLVEKVSAYISAFMWIGAAGFMVHYSQLIRVIQVDPRVNRVPLNFAFGCTAGVVGLFFYLAIYLPWWKRARLSGDYNQSHPDHVKMTVLLAVLAWVGFVIGLWPVWGWITPIMMTVLGISSIFFIGMLPNFGISPELQDPRTD